MAAPWAIVAGSILGAAAAAMLMRRALRSGALQQPAYATGALRSLRLQSGLGYVELAQRTGIPVRELAEIEHGLRPLDPEQRRRLANVLGITQRLIVPPERRGAL
jgi:hypothetical protein